MIRALSAPISSTISSMVTIWPVRFDSRTGLPSFSRLTSWVTMISSSSGSWPSVWTAAFSRGT